MKNPLPLSWGLLAAVLCSTMPCPAAWSGELDANGLYFEKTQKKFRVEKVMSADTIRLASGERVRLIGLKAPPPPRSPKTEYDDRGAVIAIKDPTQTLETRALEFAQELLQDQEVRLEFDAQKKDQDFYLLAYVFRLEDNLLVNAEILRQGYAGLRLTPPNLKHEETLRAAYQEARKERRGIHENY